MKNQKSQFTALKALKLYLSMDDELRSEYDLTSLKVRKVGEGRKNLGKLTVYLEPDVAAMFPNSKSVNEALRFLIRVTQKNKSFVSKQE